MKGVFGRTNLELPAAWLAPMAPSRPQELPALAEALAASSRPLDLASNVGLWGGHLRGTHHFLTVVGARDVARATDEKHASDLVQAHLIETLCALGREWIDVYCLNVSEAWEEYQIHGALLALESARAEGHVRFFGLDASGDPFGALGFWQFHDAFEVLRVPRVPGEDEPWAVLSPLARERRVGTLAVRPFGTGDADRTRLQQMADAGAVAIPVSAAEEVAWVEALP